MPWCHLLPGHQLQLTRKNSQVNYYHDHDHISSYFIILVKISIGLSQNAGSWYSKQRFNSLWPSHAISQHRSGSTLAKVMNCCLTAPSHYLNQCKHHICETLWDSPESNFTVRVWGTILYDEFKNYTFEITATSPSSQWVDNMLAPHELNESRVHHAQCVGGIWTHDESCSTARLC